MEFFDLGHAHAGEQLLADLKRLAVLARYRSSATAQCYIDVDDELLARSVEMLPVVVLEQC